MGAQYSQMLDTPFDSTMTGDLGQSSMFGQDSGITHVTTMFGQDSGIAIGGGYNGGPAFGQDSGNVSFGQDDIPDPMLEAVEGAIDANDPYAIGQALGLMGSGTPYMASWAYGDGDSLL